MSVQYPVLDEYAIMTGAANVLDPSKSPRSNARYFGAAGINTAAPTAGVLVTVAVPVQIGDVVSQISFRSATSAASTPTHWWFALYDGTSANNLLAATADQTTTAWGARTTKTLTLSLNASGGTLGNPVTITQAIAPNNIVYAGCMVAGTTPPSFYGITFSGANDAVAPLSTTTVYSQTSGSGLTTAAPSTIASPSNAATCPFAWLS